MREVGEGEGGRGGAGEGGRDIERERRGREWWIGSTERGRGREMGREREGGRNGGGEERGRALCGGCAADRMLGRVAATSVGFVANLFKQNQLYPVASGFDASDKDKRQGGQLSPPPAAARSWHQDK